MTPGEQERHKRVDGYEKRHPPPLVYFFTMLVKIDNAVKGEFGGSRKYGQDRTIPKAGSAVALPFLTV
jgi:hypothetical protein